MDNYHKLCKEYLEKIKSLLAGRSDLEYDTLVKLCGTGDAVTIADVKYRCEALFKKLQVHNDPDINTIVEYELIEAAEAEEAAEQQRQEAEKQRQEEAARLAAEAAEQQRQEAAEQQRQEAAEAARQEAEEKRQATEAARLAEQQRQEAEKQRQEEEKRQATEAARLAEQQRQEAEKQRQEEEKRQATEAAEQPDLLTSIKNNYIIDMEPNDEKKKLIETVFNAFSNKMLDSKMSDYYYAIVKTIFEHIAKSTDWDEKSSNSLNSIVQGINNTSDSNDYKSILNNISQIKEVNVKQQALFNNLMVIYENNITYITDLRGSTRTEMITNNYGKMAFGGDDDYSGGRMALDGVMGGVMGGAIMFSENAVAILMVTCILLLMYLIQILYYQPCSGYKNRGHIYCGSLQNNEAVQYVAY